jgi:hypothetical protein
VSKAFNSLMPASSSLIDLVAEQLAAERAAVEPLQGQPQLIAIARVDRELALRYKASLDCAEEGDFEGALNMLDHIALSLRNLHIESLADESGVVR